MGKYCEVCNKGVMSGNKVSHSNRKTKRTWAPNIQTVHVLVNGAPKKNERMHALPSFRQGRAQRISHALALGDLLPHIEPHLHVPGVVCFDAGLCAYYEKEGCVMEKALYLVTGAAGHLGNTVVGSLLALNQQVRALILPSERPRPSMQGAEIVEGDVCLRDSLAPFF